jgi:hypothetical protein
LSIAFLDENGIKMLKEKNIAKVLNCTKNCAIMYIYLVEPFILIERVVCYAKEVLYCGEVGK